MPKKESRNVLSYSFLTGRGHAEGQKRTCWCETTCVLLRLRVGFIFFMKTLSCDSGEDVSHVSEGRVKEGSAYVSEPERIMNSSVKNPKTKTTIVQREELVPVLLVNAV